MLKKRDLYFAKTYAKKDEPILKTLQSHVSAGSTTDHEQTRSRETKPIKTAANRKTTQKP
jgi:hypothetical protein